MSWSLGRRLNIYLWHRHVVVIYVSSSLAFAQHLTPSGDHYGRTRILVAVPLLKAGGTQCLLQGCLQSSKLLEDYNGLSVDNAASSAVTIPRQVLFSFAPYWVVFERGLLESDRFARGCKGDGFLNVYNELPVGEADGAGRFSSDGAEKPSRLVWSGRRSYC